MIPNSTNIPLRPYGKSELAHMYIGYSCSDSNARHWLRLEILKCPGLHDELLRLGYSPKQKCFTIAQVRAIFAAIGEPSAEGG